MKCDAERMRDMIDQNGRGMAQVRLLLEEELINEIEFVRWEQHCAQIWGWPERSIYRQIA